MDPASMHPEQLASTPTKQDLLNKVLELLVKAQEQESQHCCDVPDGYYQNSKQKGHMATEAIVLGRGRVLDPWR